MDAGVASGLLHLATQGVLPVENAPGFEGLASKRPATASGCGGAGPSTALPLLPDAPRHRLRRGALHPAPRRSQRRSTPFFSSLLVFRRLLLFRFFRFFRFLRFRFLLGWLLPGFGFLAASLLLF